MAFRKLGVRVRMGSFTIVWLYDLLYCARGYEVGTVKEKLLIISQLLATMSEFYSLSADDGKGNNVTFESLRGKVVLIVNVASLCGFTPQYNDLQYLYEKYHKDGLEVLAFPCNQFGGQEPSEHETIQEFVKAKFNVTFPIMAKVEVNGSEAHPVYNYLKNQKEGTLGFKGIRWNFEKFVVDRLGHVVARILSGITPKQIEPLIRQLVESDVL